MLYAFYFILQIICIYYVLDTHEKLEIKNKNKQIKYYT